MNAALRVADELSGCDSNRSSGYELWSSALAALRQRGRALDSENMERLFWSESRHVCPLWKTGRLGSQLPTFFFFLVTQKAAGQQIRSHIRGMHVISLLDGPAETHLVCVDALSIMVSVLRKQH